MTVYLCRLCQGDGSWSVVAPSCNIITCGIPPTVEYAQWRLLNISTNYQALASYTCLHSMYNIALISPQYTAL